MYAQLGNIIFERLFSPATLSKSKSAKLPELDRIGKKPIVQFTGLKLETMSINIRLHRSFIDPNTVLDQFKSYISSAEVVPFIDGTGKYHGKYVVQDFSEDWVTLDTDGAIIDCNCTVELKEYANDVEAAESLSLRSRATSISENNPLPALRVETKEIDTLETVKLTAIARANTIDSFPLIEQAASNSAERESLMSRVGTKMQTSAEAAQKAYNNVISNPAYGLRSGLLEGDLGSMESLSRAMSLNAKNGNLSGLLENASAMGSVVDNLDDSIRPISILLILRRKL